MNSQTTVYWRVKLYVKDYLKSTGKKQAFLAQELGYTPKKFSNLLNGKALMHIEDLENICNFFRISADEFIVIKRPA